MRRRNYKNWSNDDDNFFFQNKMEVKTPLKRTMTTFSLENFETCEQCEGSTRGNGNQSTSACDTH